MNNHYDPNQPRRADGQWTDAGDAIRAAASDNKGENYLKEALKENPKLKHWNIKPKYIDDNGNYVLYHGTTEAGAKNILQEGLKTDNVDINWFMLTTEKEVASKEFSQGKVVEFRLPLKDIPNLIWFGKETSYKDVQHALKVKTLDKKYITKIL